ncbi:unnamed protein product [Arabidopsis lyrata]|uniref:non-specific serine/threonine protein kinase n=1 Tax=Arabidopsis lyrata subsp. lyrata TaxID=81972 RepID=D7KUW4_ARALL|nr:LEAF RUST 10 DISEASE-RESISTANCE LOCUS RECEPTOR-LIKE PROTEIN KINASE-like 2.8 isoform X1 [Arabidopsis lyrata subsp. lyrata]EFH64819.1 hypothetical protein ARALYDRAFT_315717 [Arabidopsis lyrata subsp. lyrata]CAH8257287.1 unnamed protein product [Arabidopsis lyrata]|eukprot:XP_002888560.1 LEAF RUST 10 DISEASE-RESISTANCE LOCUS RECEPTOR-LIKE PROTEIN KINASE-like 2.8 isoform X1 [Arabidopsis lyrata subsp. lyrata]
MYHLPTSCLVRFFLLSLFHPLPCDSSKQGLGWCETLFQCGNITAGFPFSGGNRHKDCGHPSLELHCNKNNITSLFISNQKYSVLHIDQISNTLTLTKQDLLGSFCSSVFTNTTLPPETFELPPTYKSVTIFYQCSSLLPNLSSYTCPGIGPIAVSENPEKHPESCRSSFTVKVPTSFDTKEKELNVTNLESVLRKGFEVKVVINENTCQECLSSLGRCHGFTENLTPGCRPPSDSEGSCGYNQTSSTFICYCKDPYSLSCSSGKSFVGWIIGGVLILILIGVIVSLVFLCRCCRAKILRKKKTSDALEVPPEPVVQNPT